MARPQPRKALYEVMAKNRAKTVYEKMPSGPAAPANSANIPPAVTARPSAPGWSKKPRIFQLNLGRIEFSLPYHLAIALLLTGILMLMIAFRIGRSTAMNAGSAETGQVASSQPQSQSKAVVTTTAAPPAPRQIPAVEPVTTAGSNRIVIKQHPNRRDLEPVQQFFTQNGIATEIIARGSAFFLVTKNTYDNPNRPGSDGFNAKQEIIGKGALYKAPQGYETFAPRFFGDAYGEKVN